MARVALPPLKPSPIVSAQVGMCAAQNIPFVVIFGAGLGTTVSGVRSRQGALTRRLYLRGRHG